MGQSDPAYRGVLFLVMTAIEDLERMTSDTQ